MVMLVGVWVGSGYGRFRDLLEQRVPFFVEFAKGRLSVVQLRHDAQKEDVQIDRALDRLAIDT